MEIAAEQQWQQAEEEEADVAADAVALQGRRPRLPNTTAAAASIGESSNGDVMVTSPEPSNGFGDGEYRQQELPNGNGDGNGGGASKWNVYFDNDQEVPNKYVLRFALGSPPSPVLLEEYGNVETAFGPTKVEVRGLITLSILSASGNCICRCMSKL
ncbi:hypothetical protein CsSME_00029507 [Camellia sinensis var. sinensis]